MNSVADRYYQGTPCRLGHSGRRYKSTGACVDCQATHGKAQRAKIKEAKAQTSCSPSV